MEDNNLNPGQPEGQTNPVFDGPISLEESTEASTPAETVIDIPSQETSEIVPPVEIVPENPVEPVVMEGSTPSEAVAPSQEVISEASPVIPSPEITVTEEPAPVVVETPQVEVPLETVTTPVDTPPVVESPVVETPVAETPVVDTNVVPEVAPEVVNETVEAVAAVPYVESNPVVSEPVQSDSFQASAAPTMEVAPEVPAPAPQVEPVTQESSLQLDPNFNVQPIEPALDEIAASKKKKKKGGGFLGFLFLLILLIAGGIAFYKFVILKPEKKYDKFFEVYESKVSKFLKATIAPIQNTMIESGTVTLETNYDQQLNGISTMSFSFKSGIDFDNQKLSIGGNLKENNKQTFEALMYLINNKLYVSSSEVYSRVLLLGDISEAVDVTEIFNKTRPGDLTTIVEKINGHALKSLEKADYSSKETKINLNGKSLFVSDSILTVNEKNIKEISKDFGNRIKSDTDLIEKLANLTDVSKEEILSSLEEALSEVDATEVPQFETKIELYTNLLNNKFAGVKVTTDNNVIFNLVCDDKTIIFTFGDIELKALSSDGKKYDVTVKMNGEDLFTGTVTKNGENNYTIETIISDYVIKLTFSYDVSDTVISKNVEFELSQDDVYFKVKYDGKTEYNVPFEELNIERAVDYNELTEEQKQEIMDNLDAAMSKSALYSSLKDLFVSSRRQSYIDNSEACSYATCDECTGNTCECKYLDDYDDIVTITCPRNY